MREGPRPIEPHRAGSASPSARVGRAGRAGLVALAAATGLGLMADSLWQSSPTYDEVMYLQVAAHWWRTGDQARVTRAGTPLTFWKLQQVPMLWALDRLGYGHWIDDPQRFEPDLLPLARVSALWIWLAAFGLVAYWSRSEERRVGKECRSLCDWSSDVCSSDLLDRRPPAIRTRPAAAGARLGPVDLAGGLRPGRVLE